MTDNGFRLFSFMWPSVFQHFGITNYPSYDLKFKVDKYMRKLKKQIIKDHIFGKYLNNQLYCEGKLYVWQLNVIFGNQINFQSLLMPWELCSWPLLKRLLNSLSSQFLSSSTKTFVCYIQSGGENCCYQVCMDMRLICFFVVRV